MPNPELTRRMRNYFQRQIAWFNQMLDELQQVEEAVDDSELEAYAARQQAHSQTMATLAREFELLQREWGSATDLSEDERAEIRALATEAEKLSVEMAKRCNNAAAALQDRLKELRVTIDELSRGRGMMRKYSADDPGADYFDREA